VNAGERFVITLYTIGSSGWDARRFFAALQTSGVKRALDIRQGGNTLLSGFAIKRDLPYYLEAIAGIDYVDLPQLAPTEEAFRAYGKGGISSEIYLADYAGHLAQTGALATLDPALLDGGCLLCSEHEPTTCHRRVAAEAIAARWPEVTVHHLTRSTIRLHYA
jgi:uncharacterized protein (DUF488 family)